MIHSRANGRNAVKSAAYCARSAMRDERTGKQFRYGRKRGLLSHELINWKRTAAALWSSAEMAETRSNARVVRELRPSLPAELPLAEQVRLVRGYSLWLRDKYGVAIQADIHAPRFLDGAEENRHQTGKLAMAQEDYLESLFDPSCTNQNFHAHILMTTREVCSDTGAFGEKTRILDDRKTGPEEILRLRQEWESRTNAALKRIGSQVRIDLRSYKTMAGEGDAPDGLVAQDHLGPRRAARSRRLHEEGEDTSIAGRQRQATQSHNNAAWQAWMLLRAWEREKSRGSAAVIAREREAARKKEADAERQRLHKTRSAKDAEAAISQATQFDSIKTGSALFQALSWASQETDETDPQKPDEFSSEVDLETYEPPPAASHPDPVLKVKRKRVRGPRSR